MTDQEIVERVVARTAGTRYELVYQTGGTGGPYPDEAKAKAAAERLLRGGRDRWIAVIDARDTNNLTRAKALWLLTRSGWEDGPRPLPNIPPHEHFSERNSREVFFDAVWEAAKILGGKVDRSSAKAQEMKVDIYVQPLEGEDAGHQPWTFGFRLKGDSIQWESLTTYPVERGEVRIGEMSGDRVAKALVKDIRSEFWSLR